MKNEVLFSYVIPHTFFILSSRPQQWVIQRINHVADIQAF